MSQHDDNLGGRTREFYQETGRQGGLKLAAERGPDYYRRIQRKGEEMKRARAAAQAEGVEVDTKAPTASEKIRSGESQPSKSVKSSKALAEVLGDPLLDLE